MFLLELSLYLQKFFKSLKMRYKQRRHTYLLLAIMGIAPPGLAEEFSDSPSSVSPAPSKFAINFVQPSADKYPSPFAPDSDQNEPEIHTSSDFISEEKLEALAEISEDGTDTTKSALESGHWELYKAAMAEVESRELRLSAAEFAEHLNQGIEINIEGLGEAKVTLIDGIYAVRSIMDDYNLCVLHFDLSQIDGNPDHPELRYYYENFVARQNMIVKRDVVVMDRKQNEENVNEYHYHRIPRFLKKEWWTKHWQSIRAKSTLGDKVYGPLFGAWQWGFTAALLNVSQFFQGRKMDGANALISPQALWIFAFGTFVGINQTIYRNIVNTGKTQAQRVMRSMIVSTIFSTVFVGLGMWTDPEIASKMGALFILNTVVSTLANVIFTQVTKDDYNVRIRTGTDMRTNTMNVQVPFIPVPIKKANLDSGLINNFIVMPFKIPDLTGFKIATMPVGKLAFYLSIVPVRFLNKRWADGILKQCQTTYDEDPSEQNAYILRRVQKAVEDTNKRWDQVKQVFIRLPVETFKTIVTPRRWIPTLKAAANAVAKTPGYVRNGLGAIFCGEALTGTRPSAADLPDLLPGAPLKIGG